MRVIVRISLPSRACYIYNPADPPWLVILLVYNDYILRTAHNGILYSNFLQCIYEVRIYSLLVCD
jgi:hypothetical protein